MHMNKNEVSLYTHTHTHTNHSSACFNSFISRLSTAQTITSPTPANIIYELKEKQHQIFNLLISTFHCILIDIINHVCNVKMLARGGTLEKPLGISWMRQPEGSLLHLTKGCALVGSRPMSTETSTTAHWFSVCCLHNLIILACRTGTSGDIICISASNYVHVTPHIYQSSFMYIYKFQNTLQFEVFCFIFYICFVLYISWLDRY